VAAALVRDPELMERTGKVLVAAALAEELGVADIDGSQPKLTNRNLLKPACQHNGNFY
jgi:hypothetical protein